MGLHRRKTTAGKSGSPLFCLLFCLAVATAPGCFDEADPVPDGDGCDAISVSDLVVFPDAPVAESDFDLRWTLGAVCGEFDHFANAPQPAELRVGLSGAGLTESAESVEPFPYETIGLGCIGGGTTSQSTMAGVIVDDVSQIGPGAYEAIVLIDGEICEPSGASASIEFEILPVGSCPGTATDTLDMQISDLLYDVNTQTIRWTLTYAGELAPGPMTNPGPEVMPISIVSVTDATTDTLLATFEHSSSEMLPLDSMEEEVPLMEVGLPMAPAPGQTAEIRVELSPEADILQCGGDDLELNDEASILVTF